LTSSLCPQEARSGSGIDMAYAKKMASPRIKGGNGDLEGP